MDVALAIVSCPDVIRAEGDFTVQVAVTNAGSETLESRGATPLHLSYRWRDEDEDREPLRTVFWQTVAPATTKLFDVRVAAPLGCSRELAVTLVREHVRWFDTGADAIVATHPIRTVPAATPLPFDVRRSERRLRSQNGEDGIIAELLRRVGWRDRFIVEFGAADGFECNSATLIEEADWGGLLIEGDPALFARLCERFGNRPKLALRDAIVTRENIGRLFREANVPRDLDVLSIDVDGNDYWLWEALHDFGPRIVVIEYNAAYPPPQRWVMAYNADHRWGGDTYHGASLSSLATLGERLGYVLVGTDSRGVNAFFVRADLAAAASLLPRDAADAYNPPAIVHPPGFGPFVER